jgi:HD-GYP domain-containing protein (c-di-GMP phosphodiesterase class II)
VPRMTVPKRPALKNRPQLSAGGRSLILATGFILTLVLGGVSLLRPSFIANLDGRFFDGLISEGPQPAGHRGPVVVALDDESLARFGRWPWPRARVAELLARIAAQHPASVGIDIIFAERELPATAGPAPDNSASGSPAPGHSASASPAPGAASPASGRPTELSPGDLALTKALAAGPFVLGYEMTFAPKSARSNAERLIHPLNLISLAETGAANPASGLWKGTGVVASRTEFSRCVSQSGFVNAAMEQDGILRRMPLLLKQGDRVYPSLALAAVLRSRTFPEAVLASTWYGESTLRIGERRIPLDERGRLLLRYRGWHGSVQPLSAAALLEGRVAPGALTGRVVLVGATATGMGEAVTTPVKVSSLLSGVQVHAIAAENILSGDFARNAPWVYRLLATLLLGALATLLCALLPILSGGLWLTLAAVAAWLGSCWLFQSSGLFLSPVLPLVALVANFSLLSPIRLFYGEKKDLRQTRDLTTTREFIMTSLTALTEIRDTETGAHIMRTQRYLLILCQELTRYPRFQPLLDPDTIELLAKLAPLHDIGKVGLPDHLLHKATAFTAEEYEEVKKHAAYGRDTILKAELRSGIRDDQLLRYAKDLAYSHHERWDGSGYPEGLRGEAIPWVGRVMAVADTYDALISRRVYKEPIPHETALRIIINGKGKLFDPDVVDAFTKVEHLWWQIACELLDKDEISEK